MFLPFFLFLSSGWRWGGGGVGGGGGVADWREGGGEELGESL